MLPLNKDTSITVKELTKQLHEFTDVRNQQKQRGLNDFNLITTTLKYHDEVRVHSRIIGSLLDINGNHYQNTLFLDKFINTIGIVNYRTNKSEVFLEYENIDLYLTDGINHIIIENKIWAKDQEKQIKRYIDAIRDKKKDINSNNLYVIYLSPDRKEPTKYSLDTYSINNGYIVNKENKNISKFININYKDKILDWLYDCKYEIQNITNLNESIKQYIDVVKMVTNEYKSLVSPYENFFLNEERFECFMKNKLENLDEKDEIEKAFENTKQKLYDDFYKNILDKIFENNTSLIYFRYIETKSTQEIQITFNQFYTINFFLNKQHTKFTAIKVGIAWAYNNEAKNNKALKKQLEDYNTQLGLNKELDYIRDNKGCKIESEHILPTPTIKNLFLAQKNQIEQNIIDEMQNIIDEMQKHIDIIVYALKQR